MKLNNGFLFIILGLSILIFIPKISIIYGEDNSQNSLLYVSKIDPKILKVLDRVNTVGDSFHTLVDVILENQSYVSDIPKDIEMVYLKNNIAGVAVDQDQIMNLARLDFVKQVTAPKGVFNENVNASIANPPAPLKQYESGIVSKYIKCKYGSDLLIMQRSDSNGNYSSPACFNWNDEIEAQHKGIGKIVNNLVKTKFWNLFGVLPSTKSFFMEHNSTGSISVKYLIYKGDFAKQLISQKPQVFSNGLPLSTSDVTISSEPTLDSLPSGQNNITVTYTIKTSGANGLYSVYIPQEGCKKPFPLVVGMNVSKISSADVATYLGNIACSSITYDSEIVHISGILIKWLPSEPYFN